MSGLIRIKKWDDFQHYKHRNPPWIRLYRRLLDPEQTPWYRGLSDNAVRFLVELWLLAARDGGTVPFDSLMILRETNRTSAAKPLLDAALTELASAGAITIEGTDASAEFFTVLGDRDRQSYRDTEIQSAETTSPAAAPPTPENPNAWKADAAVTLRKAGVVEREIGDALKNFWAPARRRFTDPEITAVVLAHGRRFAAKDETWNPARVWNPRNADFDERFRWAISQQRKAEARSPTKGIKTVQQIIGGAA